MARLRDITKEKKAKHLLKQGYAKAEIARQLGVSYVTVLRWVDAKYEKYFREQALKGRTTIEGRVAHSIAMSKTVANRNNHQPCLATVKQIVIAYKGRCELCGIEENKLKSRLHIDHCHKTGKFRGWLCCGCNVWLYRLEADTSLLKRVEKYLK